jgi:hypothetical protein
VHFLKVISPELSREMFSSPAVFRHGGFWTFLLQATVELTVFVYTVKVAFAVT